MEIYFIKIDDFFKNIDKSSLYAFLEGNNFASDKRKTEFCLGRFLIKYVLKNRFGIDNPKILLKNKKPYIENNDICFSLTHSHSYVMAVFDKSNVSIDLELMKQRDFKKLFEHYNLEVENPDRIGFYKFWTGYEAEIKLQSDVKSKINALFQKDYCLCVCSQEDCDISKTLKIYELKSPTQRIKPSELINLKLVIESKKNENTLVAQDINTAAFEFELLEPLKRKIE